MRAELAVEPDAHALRPLHRDHLRRQDMLELARAAAKRQRAEPADRAGMAVRHRMRRAGQHHAEFGRDDMGDALLRIVEIEHADVVRRLPSRIARENAAPSGLVVSSRPGFVATV